MNPLLNYVIQVIIVSGLLYSYYHWVLRNKKFHHYNRYYLLGAALLSILIPLLNIPVYFTEEQTSSSFVYSTLTVFSGAGEEEGVTLYATIPEKANWFTWNHILPLIYLTVAAIVFLRIVFSLLKINRIIRRHTVEKIDRIRFLNTDEPGTPYSFFRWLFWNRKIELNSVKGEQIFRHELFHIEQKHSLDILFFELLTIAGWFNPFFHLMKRETRAIHEFLADQFAVTENNRWDYAELLLMQVLNTHQRLVHPFFHNQIKRRIAMIISPQKTSLQYLRKMMVLPVAALAVMLFAFSYKKSVTDPLPFQNNITRTERLSSQPVLDTTVKPETDKVYTKVEIEAAYPGGMDAWRKYLERNLNAEVPIFSKAPAGVYTVIIQFIVNLDGTVSDAKALTNHGYGMEAEAIRVIENGGKWLPAIQNGRQVVAYRKQPITFVVNNGPKKEGKVMQGKGKELNEVVVVGYSANTDPAFPGGDSAWKKYLAVNADVLVPVNNGVPEGIYKTRTRFIVHPDGTISDITALTHFGYGMEEEAIRLIKKGPRWIPATREGTKVSSYKEQTISFLITGEPDRPDYPPVIQDKQQSNILTVNELKKIDVFNLLQLPKGTEIISYLFSIDRDKELIQIPNRGSQINPQTQVQLNEATPGRLITIDLIVTRALDEQKNEYYIKKIPSRVWYVKD
ncbi:MAG: energy transducer TonB [Sphingobacteriales bacterium]|nr:energy transducer TonB [Sphingobacteriales bacterium]